MRLNWELILAIFFRNALFCRRQSCVYVPEWFRGFVHRGGYAPVPVLSAPPLRGRSISFEAICEEAPQSGAENLSNFRRQDGHPPGAKTNRMATWSMLRSWLLKHWPAHMLVWYALVLLGSPSLVLRVAIRSRHGLEPGIGSAHGPRRILRRFAGRLSRDLPPPAPVSPIHRLNNLLRNCARIAPRFMRRSPPRPKCNKESCGAGSQGQASSIPS